MSGDEQDSSSQSASVTDRITAESVGVQDNGIRIPHCPRCDQPIMIEYGLSTGKFGPCPWEECDAYLTHDVTVVTVACDTREGAKAHFEVADE